MQEQQPRRQFGKETAKFIAELVNNQSGGYEFLEVRDDGHTPGVYVSETYIGLFPSGVEGIEVGNVFEWNPACDTEDETDPEATPLLPVPFTAKELAAFLLYGVGDYIQERLGRIGQLDEDQLSKLGGVRKKLPRQALRAAYAEAERAQQIVGLPDIEAQELAYLLSEQLDEAEREENHRQGVFARDISPEEASRRRALVVESLADLRKRTQVAKSEAAAKTAQWRSAMVRQLLEALPQTPEQPAGIEPEQPAGTDAEPVPEEAASSDTDLENPLVRPKRQNQADRIKACLAECECRAAEKGLVFDLQNMPGVKADLLDFLHNKDGDNLRSIKSISSLDRYLKGVCKWSNSAHTNPPATPLYAKLFPELGWAPRAVLKQSTQQRKT